VQYDNGSDEAFLRWLWYELYGDEPFEASNLTRLKALPEPFAERDWTRGTPTTSAKPPAPAHGGKALELLLTGLAETSAPVSPAEREELTALLAAIGQPAAAISVLSVSTALSRAAEGSAHPLLQHRLPPC
jgi:hypothetical protein